MSVVPAWIAVDWGTTRLRAWAMNSSGLALAETATEDGMGGLAPHDFEPALIQAVDPWLRKANTPILACGMVGARQAWHEVGYLAVPITPGALVPVRVPDTDHRIRLWILPGLCQDEPADVMRGEETQIAGFLVDRPEFDGVLCLPGTHSKWVRISAGEVVSFQTAMTGEMYQLFHDHSVIRHTLRGAGAPDHEAFDQAVSDMISRPEKLTQKLFSIRAEAVLDARSPAAARSTLSGLLIGAELAATRAYWLGHAIVVAGAPALAAHYGRALASQGANAEVLDAGPLTRRGLAAAFAAMSETTP
ncbi:MAG: 2-dehydro-3-deoxygalactonokinase [Pseudomonadota bacterium]